jgi:hypothetical protein
MKIKIKRFGKKKINPLFEFDYPIYLLIAPIENITAQVQDVEISTAHWALFTFWQPRKSAFYKLKLLVFDKKNLMI